MARFFLAVLALGLPFALGLSGCDDSRSSAALDLISAFGSGCVTSGGWADQALAHSQSIATVIQNIKDDDPCKPFQATLGTIQAASQQIQGLLKDQAYSDYRTSEETVQDLTLALRSAPHGSDLSAALQQALVQAQVGLAQNQGANEVDQAVRGKNQYVYATQNLAGFVQEMLQQTNGLSQCLQRSPSVAVELATNLLAIGGSFISPIYGAGAATIGQLINYGVEYARENSIDQALQDINAIQMPHALGCGMEAMSELYCDAEDSESLLQLSSNSQIDHPIPDFWLGIDLLTKRMPILDQWLLSIRNGILPQDSQDAARQNQIWQKWDNLDQIYRTVYGLLSERKKTFDGSSGNPENQQQILLHAIGDAVGAISGNNGRNSCVGNCPPDNNSYTDPYADLSTDSDTLACWLALDPNDAPPNPRYPPGQEPKGTCPSHIPNTGDYGEAYIQAHLLAGASFPALFANLDGLKSRVQQLLDVEFAQNITADPNSILASAKKASTDNLSPYDILRRLQRFLRMQLDLNHGSDPNEDVLLNEVLASVTDAIATIDDHSVDPIERVKRLFDTFDLDHGLQKIDTNVNLIVQWDLNARVKAHQFPTDVDDILLTSGAAMVDRLAAAGLSGHTDLLNKDLTDAQEITTGNLDVFGDFFSPVLANAVRYLSENAASHGEPLTGADRPFGQALGHLCTMILQTRMQWPENIPWETCSKAVYNSVFTSQDGELTIRLDALAKQLSGKDYKYRACAFHRFLRASRYAEVYSHGLRRRVNDPNTAGDLGFFWSPKDL